MSATEPFMIKVPGSTANLGPGFDSIGMAVNRYLTLEVVQADEWIIEISSAELASIPTGEDNLLCQVANAVAKERNQQIPPCHITMTSTIPLARGLGSSAAAHVAGIDIANQLLGYVLSVKEKVHQSSRWYGHLEIVA